MRLMHSERAILQVNDNLLKGPYGNSHDNPHCHQCPPIKQLR